MTAREVDISHLLEAHCEDGDMAVSNLQDAIDRASDQDQMTWLADHGKRVAAIVPVEDGEFAERLRGKITDIEARIAKDGLGQRGADRRPDLP